MECQEFLQVADKLPHGMLLINSEGLILAANKQASQLLQILPQNLANKNISSITVAPEVVVIERLRPCYRTRSPATLSIELINDLGTITTGFLFTPSTNSSSATVLLNLQKGRPSSTHFLLLNQEIDKQKNLMRLLTQSRDNLEKEVNNRTSELLISLDKAKKIETELLEKGERLSLATKANGVGIWEFNFQTHSLEWDDSMYTLYHMSRKDFSSSLEAWSSSIHPDDEERMKQEEQHAIVNKKHLDTEFRIRWPDGEIRFIKGVARMFYDRSNTPIRMLGTNIDITERKKDEENLRKSNELWQFALEGSGDGVWEYNIQTGQSTASARLMQILGLESQSNIANVLNDFTERLHPNSQPFNDETFQAVIDGETNSCVLEQQVRCEDGSYKWLLTRGMVISHTPDGKPLRMVGTVSDISASKKESLEKLQLAASVFSHAREAIIITDASNNILEVNNTFTEITGYTNHEVIGRDPILLQSSDKQPTSFYSSMWQTINATNYWSGEVWFHRKNGQEYPTNFTVSAVKNDLGKISHYVILFSDTTRLKEHQNQLEKMANYDDLTSLPNRTLLRDRLNQAMIRSQRNAESLAVTFMDLDGFKAVNDTYGHDLGDALLIKISQRMKAALREGDTLARFGGDEFIAIFLDLKHIDECKPLIERLLKAASTPVDIDGNLMQLSVSIGVTLYPQDGADEDQLVRHADQAMYEAKLAGKNCFKLFDTAQDEEISTRLKTLENVNSALDKKQFELYYQPKVNMHSGEVIGLEALIRWRHPTRGLVPPLEFLPVIEGHNIALEVGRWVINKALSQMNQWRQIGINMPISVNVSPYQLEQDNFVIQLEELLSDYPDIPRSFLELEILESSALGNINRVITTMNECHRLGVQLALDDFGTGYSSLTHLRRLPAHIIKIDQSFVRDILEDPDDLAFVEGVIGLAKSFKRDVIAEGVETIEHGIKLLNIGCVLAQGYGIARPMPATDIPAWLDKWKSTKWGQGV
jgi:diguanylate cyclase (GGDEF)-like protein/PAS domain S-box-containing protein